MACPYFFPVTEADLSARPRPARAPLGTIWRGLCYARPGQPVEPPEESLYEPCNFGYPREVCTAFPEDATVHAVRFTPWRGSLIYILEKDHSPVEYGHCNASVTSPVLTRQFEAYTQATCLNK